MGMDRLRCSEVWGGVRDIELDVCTNGLRASVCSVACEGGKGGDIYYFSLCSHDMFTRIAVADVAGHGRAVSDISEWLYDSMHAKINSLDGHAVLADLNRLAAERGLEALTTAAVIGIYKRDAHAYCAYAGHHPALFRRVGEETWGELRGVPGPGDGVGLPLGIDPQVDYNQWQTPIAPGDRLVLYTDGIIEAPDSRGRPFGKERFRDVLHRAGGEKLADLRSAVFDEVRRHTGGRLSHDDVTLLAIDVL